MRLNDSANRMPQHIKCCGTDVEPNGIERIAAEVGLDPRVRL